jgi:hypothetical protein
MQHHQGAPPCRPFGRARSASLGGQASKGRHSRHIRFAFFRKRNGHRRKLKDLALENLGLSI